MFDPDEFSYSPGNCFLRLFGLPFFCAGLGALYGSIGNAQGLGLALFGLLFAAVGLGFVGGRRGVVVNRRAGTVSSWWGVLFPFSRKERPLGEGSDVYLVTETRRSKNSSYTVYVVYVRASGEKVRVDEFRQYDPARKLGERVAKAAHLGMHDAGGGAVVVREAGTLDESLRARYLREGKIPQMPEKPPGCQVQEHIEGETAHFELPKPKAGCTTNGVLIGGLLPIGVFAIFITSAVGVNPGTAWTIYLGIGGVFLVLIAGAIINVVTMRERIEVSTREVAVIHSSVFGTRRGRIASDDLEELELGRAPGGSGTYGAAIIARSDTATLCFGSGLSGGEQRWLREVVLCLVTAPGG